jgi:hypothetical protein
MSKKIKTPALTNTIDARALESRAIDSARAAIAHFEGLALTDAKHEKTAKQWANELRVTLTPSLFDDAAKLVAQGDISSATIERALGALVDVDGKRAPVYGLVKLASIVRSLASGSKHHSMSDLHRACILALSDDWDTNENVHKGIARECFVSVTGTAPTQRSSSAYALRSLGLIEESTQGRVGLMRWTDSDTARRLATIVRESSPLVVKGA